MLFLRLFRGVLGRDTHLYLYNFYLHSLGNNRHVKRILRFLMNNDRLTLIAQTPGEKDYYRKLSKKINLEFVPYCSDVEERQNTVSLDEGYIFTGGYTNRDYPLMMQLAERMPERKFLFVASKLNGAFDRMPKNVELRRDVSPQEFADLMAGAAIVVAPLKEDVGSSGQMLCIQAMRYHKPIVYTNVSSISYYFAPDSGMPYEIGNIDSLHQAVTTVTADADLARTMGDNAYRESKKYTSEQGQKQLDSIVLGELS